MYEYDQIGVWLFVFSFILLIIIIIIIIIVKRLYWIFQDDSLSLVTPK